MDIKLDEHQKMAIKQLKTGSILCGGTGSGKSRTALAYFYVNVLGGTLNNDTNQHLKNVDLYIITTAKKRDSLEWEDECDIFNFKGFTITIDSWQNIKKYVGISESFFIFDEQRVVGGGVWSKAFIKIAKTNDWIMLSATPGDNWMDYISVFVANGFYKNRTEFINRHVVYKRFGNFSKPVRYLECQRLNRLRENVLVDMDYVKSTEQIHIHKVVPYDKITYKDVMKRRWDIFRDEPIQNAGEFCRVLRMIVNTDPRRIEEVKDLICQNPRSIIFYNFDYELKILRDICEELGITRGEWNGHVHSDIPDTSEWVYLVQYTAGAEGWNCTSTNVIIFYSQNYSYKTMVQACGRIDRRNTPYKNLYYYHIRSNASIDLAILKALQNKKKFNERKFAG